MCLLTVQRLRVGQVFLELLVQIFTDSDVLEHSLQFGRVFEATRLLQEDKHKTRSGQRLGFYRYEVKRSVLLRV